MVLMICLSEFHALTNPDGIWKSCRSLAMNQRYNRILCYFSARDL